MVDGWTPTSDLGTLGEDGYLTLLGRIDDCVRVRDGRLVNLAFVAARLREVASVTDAAVLAVETSAGPTFGAVVEGTAQLAAVRQHLARELPPWCWPRELVAVPVLPRLPGGKIDREACRRLLAGVDQS